MIYFYEIVISGFITLLSSLLLNAKWWKLVNTTIVIGAISCLSFIGFGSTASAALTRANVSNGMLTAVFTWLAVGGTASLFVSSSIKRKGLI